MAASLRRKQSNVIIIPSASHARPRAATSPRGDSSVILPDITFSPTSDFHLDFFDSNAPALHPPSSHPYATLPRRNVSFQSSGSDSSVPRPMKSSDLARTPSDTSPQPSSSTGRLTPSAPAVVSTFSGPGFPADQPKLRERTSTSGFGRSSPAARSVGQSSSGGTSVNGRLLARPPKSGRSIQEDEKEDEDDDDSEVDEFSPKTKTIRKESLAELLSSPPPWQSKASPEPHSRPSPPKHPVAVGTSSPPTSFQASANSPRSSSMSRMSKSRGSVSSPSETSPAPAVSSLTGPTMVAKPVARSPRIDGDTEFDLASDDESTGPGSTLRKQRASPASELISFFSETQPPPKAPSPASSAGLTRNTSSPTPYLRSSPSGGSRLSLKEPSSAGSSFPSPPEKPKEKKGFKGLMFKVLGKDSDNTSSSNGIDRSIISQPTPTPAGSVQLMRTTSLDQPTRDLQDHAQTVVLPQEPTTRVPPLPNPVRPRTKSAFARDDLPEPPFVRIASTSKVDNGESYLPRDDPTPRSRTVSQTSVPDSLTAAAGRPPPSMVPRFASNELDPQDRLETPARSMSISRKPVSPELRTEADCPPDHPMPSVSPEASPAPSPTRHLPLASRLAQSVTRAASSPTGRSPLPTIYSPTSTEDSPALAASPPRPTSMPDGPRPDVSPASTITMKDDLPVMTAFPVPPVAGGESPSRTQKSLAGAFSAKPSNSTDDRESPALGVFSSSTSATEDDEPVTPQPSHDGTPTILSLPFAPAAPVAPVNDQARSTALPSIPLSELVHLRSLLANASTADECRLLVNALLALWKVPFAGLPPSAPGPSLASDETRAVEEGAREDQVARVFAWLLSEAGSQVPAASTSDQGSPTFAPPPRSTERLRSGTPATPRVIPPTPVHPSDLQFAPASPSTITTGEGASVHSAEEMEEAEYEVRVVAGRAAISKAIHSPSSSNGQRV